VFRQEKHCNLSFYSNALGQQNGLLLISG